MTKYYLALTLATLAMTSGCASKQENPILNHVCIQTVGLQDYEKQYLDRKANQYLADYGFIRSSSSCEASVKYQVFGAFQGESITNNGLWTSRDGYWSQEGIATITINGKPLYEDFEINLRGHSSKQELLESLAWSLIKPITRGFRPSIPPK